jgi:hypothetical protein
MVSEGQLLIATRFGDVDQLHLVEQPGGARRQLTFLHEPVTEAAFSPDPCRSAYVYLKDSGGNENAQLYYQRVGEAGATLLTDGKSLNGAPVWSNSGREVAFFSTARDGRSFDIDIVDPESGALPRLSRGGRWQRLRGPLDWSPDDSQTLGAERGVGRRSVLVRRGFEQRAKARGGPLAGKVAIAGAKFTRDGQGVYLISDRDSEFARLRYVNLFTNDKTVISEPVLGHRRLAISRDGHYLAYISNEAGAGKAQSARPAHPPGSHAAAAAAVGHHRFLELRRYGYAARFRIRGPNQPRDAYVFDIAENQSGALDAQRTRRRKLRKIRAPRLTQFPTFDRVDGKARSAGICI